MKVLIDMPHYAPGIKALTEVSGVVIVQVEQPEEKVRALPVELIHDCDVLFCTFPPEPRADATVENDPDQFGRLHPINRKRI